MKPRLRAEAEGQTIVGLQSPRTKAGLRTLFICGLRPNKRNSVFALLRQSRFEVIQSAVVLRVVCKREMFSVKLSGWKDMNSWVSCNTITQKLMDFDEIFRISTMK